MHGSFSIFVTVQLTAVAVMLGIAGCNDSTPSPGDGAMDQSAPVPESGAVHDGGVVPQGDSGTVLDSVWHPTDGQVQPSPDASPSGLFSCPVVTDRELHDAPSLSKPAYLGSYLDPVFGHKVTRITGNPGDSIPNVSGTWGTVERHFYSKIQAWNADGSLLWLGMTNGGHPHLYLDGKTYQVKFAKNGPGEQRWHPTKPAIRLYVKDNEIGSWNVNNDQETVHATQSGYSNFKFGPGEGNPSLDGNRLAVLAISPAGKQVAFAFDIPTKTKYPDIDLEGSEVDWVSISPLGTYVVFNGDNDTTRVYDLQGNQVGSTWSAYGRPSHNDMTVDANGDEVAVGRSKSNPDDGLVIKRRLKDGQVTALTPSGVATHTTTRNILQPGWAFVTYMGEFTWWPLSEWPYFGELTAVRLDGSKQVVRLAHLRAKTTTYQSQPQGSVSADGKQVLFASNWGNGNGPVQAYVVEICKKP